MRLGLLLGCCILFSAMGLAQEFQFQKGEVDKDRFYLNKKFEYSVVDEQGNYIAIRPHPSMSMVKYSVEFYDGVELSERVDYDTPRDTELLDCFAYGNRLFVTKHVLDGRDVSLRVDVIDLTTKERVEKTLLQVHKKENPDLFKSLLDYYNVFVHVSDEIILTTPFVTNKTLGVRTTTYNYVTDESTSSEYFPDKNLSRKEVSYLNTFLHNGTMFSIFSVNPKEGQNAYRIVKFGSGGETTLDIPIPEGMFELINTHLDGDQLIISGLYSTKKRMKFEGYTMYKADLDSMSFLNYSSTPFTAEQVQNYFSGFFTKKKYIDINNIYSDDQGNTYVIGQTHVVQRQAVPMGVPIAAFTIGSVSVFVSFQPTVKEKLYDDILIAKFDTNGEMVWEKLVELGRTEKIKSTSNHRDSSLYTYFEDDKIHIFMNGKINFNREKLVVKQNKRKGATSFYDIVVDDRGGLTVHDLFSNADSEIIFRAGTVTKQDNTIYILGQGNMRKQLLKMKY